MPNRSRGSGKARSGGKVDIKGALPAQEKAPVVCEPPPDVQQAPATPFSAARQEEAPSPLPLHCAKNDSLDLEETRYDRTVSSGAPSTTASGCSETPADWTLGVDDAEATRGGKVARPAAVCADAVTFFPRTPPTPAQSGHAPGASGRPCRQGGARVAQRMRDEGLADIAIPRSLIGSSLLTGSITMDIQTGAYIPGMQDLEVAGVLAKHASELTERMSNALVEALSPPAEYPHSFESPRLPQAPAEATLAAEPAGNPLGEGVPGVLESAMVMGSWMSPVLSGRFFAPEWPQEQPERKESKQGGSRGQGDEPAAFFSELEDVGKEADTWDVGLTGDFTWRSEDGISECLLRLKPNGQWWHAANISNPTGGWESAECLGNWREVRLRSSSLAETQSPRGVLLTCDCFHWACSSPEEAGVLRPPRHRERHLDEAAEAGRLRFVFGAAPPSGAGAEGAGVNLELQDVTACSMLSGARAGDSPRTMSAALQAFGLSKQYCAKQQAPVS